MTSPIRYGRSLIALHWLTALCLLVSVSLVFYADDLDDRALHARLIDMHKTLGVIVLALTLARLLLRLGELPPPARLASRLMSWLARLSHLSLYLMLAATPVTGWMMSSAAGRPVALGPVVLPPLVGRDRDLADTLHDVHEFVAYAFLALIALHVLAALWHQFRLRDGLMARMSLRAGD